MSLVRQCIGFWAVLLALSLLAGCATLREDVPRGKPSYALSPNPAAPLAGLAAGHLKATSSPSAFRLLESGQSALAARMALIERARYSLDLQYYIFRSDTSGKLMMDALIRAAERGVRVRLLLDDMYSLENEPAIIGLDANPRIQVRLYNPFKVRGNTPLGRLAEYVAGDGRVNRRMHNKLFLADNYFGITGGRNVGDEYFQADQEVAFRDLDVLATGAIVEKLSESFDRYWNAPQAITARALPKYVPRRQLSEELKQDVTLLRAGMTEQMAGFLNLDVLGTGQESGWGPWTGGVAELVVDDPAKTDKAVKQADLPVNQLLHHGMEVRRELLIASPYFVPGNKGVEWLRQMRHRDGVKVKVLTNSLAATDVAAVHAGYARYREPLLAAGVELFELKPLKERMVWGRQLLQGSSRASLHGKAVVFDRKVAYVGSMNLDPRSVVLNTESGLLLHGNLLAGQVARFIEEGMRPENSYRVAINPTAAEDGDALLWHDQRVDGEVIHRHDPRTNAILRGYINMLSILPIEGDL